MADREAPAVTERTGAQRHSLGLLLVTVSAVAWSTTGLFTRVIPLDTATLLVWRGFFGAIGLLVVIFFMQRGGAVASFRRLGWPGLAYALVSAAGMLLFITSLRHTTVAHVAIIYAAAPFIAAGLAWITIGERPSRNAAVASVGALAGVAVMAGLGLEGGLLGDVLALGMTIAMAGIMVIARAHPDIPAMPAACLSALLSAAAAAPFGDAFSISLDQLGLLALFGLVNSALGLSLFVLGSRYLPPIETALIGALDAPLAPIWVWLILGETPGLATLAGGTIVLVAVFAHIMTVNRQEPPP